MALLRAAVFAALSLLLGAVNVLAQDVTLSSQDGDIEISGTLLGFDGQFYRVETVYGELTVDGSGVRCEGPGCPNLTDFVAELRFSGSSTMGEVLVPALIEGFALRSGLIVEREDIDPERFDYTLRDGQSGRRVARLFFRVTTTDEGFADLLANEADIVMSLREITQEERDRALEAGLGDLTGENRSRVLALDAFVPVTAAGNPLRSISLSDLSLVLSGEIDNWSALGGPDAPISVHMPSAASGLAQAAERRLLTRVDRVISPNVIRHKRSSMLARAVAVDPFAIGIASFAETDATRMLTLTGECGFSLAATRRTIKTEDYPLTSPMFLYLPARRLPKIGRDFLAYMRGPAAQIVIRRAGFVDQAAEEISINAQGDRFANAIAAAGDDVSLSDLQNMVRQLHSMARLTTTFRFETGSARLDAQSRSNVEQFARALESGAFDARRIVFAGFSDGEGPAATNRKIAAKRAEAVRDAVLRMAETLPKDRVVLDTVAFGEAMPMACDDSAWGAQVNRRVEVWLE